MDESQGALNKKTLNENFDEDMKLFMLRRMERANYHTVPEYVTTMDNYSKLLEKIESLLPQDVAKDITFELDDVVGSLGRIEQDVDYRLGFEDGIRFYKIGESIR